jgi:hypothetical protein
VHGHGVTLASLIGVRSPSHVAVNKYPAHVAGAGVGGGVGAWVLAIAGSNSGAGDVVVVCSTSAGVSVQTSGLGTGVCVWVGVGVGAGVGEGGALQHTLAVQCWSEQALQTIGHAKLRFATSVGVYPSYCTHAYPSQSEQL